MQVASDLHLSLRDMPDFKGIITPSASVLILAGDICELSEDHIWKPFLRSVAPSFKTVLWLCGNHEHHYVKKDDDARPSMLKQVIAAHKWIDTNVPNVYIVHEPIVFPLRDLDPDKWADDARRLVMVTLWTHLNSPASRNYMTTDFNYIPNWSPHVHNACHMHDLKFLQARVRRGDIVVTHHPPVLDRRASPDKYKNQAEHHALHFGSNALSAMRIKPALWVFGHTHHRADFIEDGVRLVSNARGHSWEQDVEPKYQSNFVVNI